MKNFLKSLLILLFLGSVFFSPSVHARKGSSKNDSIGSDPNKQGLDNSPTAIGWNWIQEIEGTLGSIYTPLDQASLSIEELANRKPVSSSTPKKSSGSSSEK